MILLKLLMDTMMIILDLIDEFELGPKSLSDSIIIIVFFWHTVEPFIFMTLS
jgi:hypothetical protein